MEPGIEPVYYRITVAARLSGLSAARVRRYVQIGLVQTVPDERGDPQVTAADLARLRKIRRLTSDLGINTPGVEVVLRLLDEIEAMKQGM